MKSATRSFGKHINDEGIGVLTRLVHDGDGEL